MGIRPGARSQLIAVARAARACVTLACAVVAMPAQSAEEPGAPLSVCMAEGHAPLAVHGKAGDGGFDVLVARAVADALGRPLQLRWYEASDDEGTSASIEASAMLSSGLCSVVAGYPLYEPALGTPGPATARIPDTAGAKPRRERAWIPLSPIEAGPAYRASTLVLVEGDGIDRPVGHLTDLKGLSIGTHAGSLADAMVRFAGGGILVPGLVSLSKKDDLLDALAAGRFKAAIVELEAWDRYRNAHPQTRLTKAEWRSNFTVNFGYVGLASASAELQSIGGALNALRANGTFDQLARQSAATYLGPVEPLVLGPVTLATILGN